MKPKTKTASRRRWRYALVLLVIPVATGLYYQLFYKAPEVAGSVRLERRYTYHQHIVTAVQFSPDDQWLITGSVDSTVQVRDRNTGALVHLLHQPQGITFLDLTGDGRRLATASYDGTVRIWSLADRTLLHTCKGHRGTVWTVAFSPDGRWVASAGDDTIIRIWDTATGQLVYSLKGHRLIPWSVRFSPDGTTLASASFDHTIKFWDLKKGLLRHEIRSHTQAVVDLAYSHDGTLLASTSDDKTIKLWNTSDISLVRTMEVPEHVQAVAFSPNDSLLLTGGRDKPMIGELLQEFFGDSHYNPGVSARLWQTSTGKLLQTFDLHANDVTDVAFSHDGRWMATSSADKTIALFRVK